MAPAGVALGAPGLSEDLVRRAAYESVCRGELSTGPQGHVVFCVYTSDLDEGRGDVYVAAGLALALHELGYGVTLLPRTEWGDVPAADVVVGLLPFWDPATAPSGAVTVAWVRNETERWSAAPHLAGYDLVLSSSAVSLRRLARATSRTGGVLPIGADTELFTLPPDDALRASTAVTTAHHWGPLRDVHRSLMELPADADVEMYGHIRPDAPDTLRRWHRPSVSYFSMPDLYRRSWFVIDDLNSTSLGFGTLNSRFFESAACGALPVTNTALGYADLGVPTVPHYRSGTELAAILDDLRRDPEDVARRAAELSRVVREQHDWRTRAQQFLELVSGSRAASVSERPRPVHFFPDYTAENPYQSALFAGLPAVGGYATPVDDLSSHLAGHSEGSGEGRTAGVLNLHWTTPILQSAGGPFEARGRLDAFRDDLDRFLSRGGRLVWTVHNVLPHDVRFRHLEVELAQLLAERADLVHVLDESTVEAAAPYYELDPARVRLVKHSSYAGLYPDWVTPTAARRRFGLLPHDKVLVALGGIRPYKGLDLLLDAFDELARHDPSLHLLVAGKPGHQPGVKPLLERLEEHERVRLHRQFVPPDQLQVWLRAADLAVLPYRNILNSGSHLLAQTFGLPVVAPRGGAFRKHAGDASLRLFDIGDPASLLETLRTALRDLVVDEAAGARAAAAARAAAHDNPPSRMAGEFAAMMAPLLADPPS
jgi:glycosyltransferase involved in cell wall biosynthesis